MNVLLVENDSETRSLLKVILEIRGHQVAEFEDGESGWSACLAQNFPLVVIDCLLPGMDGLELCRKIRGLPERHNSFILVITARSKFSELQEVLAAGADDYLSKPVDLQPLSIRITIAEQRVNNLLAQTASLDSMRDRLELLSEAQNIAQVGSWKLHLQTGELIWSDEVFRIFEVDKTTFPGTYQGFLNAIHPDDREKVNKAYSDSVANHTPCEINHRIRRHDGHVKWVNERCKTVYDDHGKPLFSVGTVQNITERKQMEDALRESEQRWSLALEGGSFGVWDWNLQTGEVTLSKAGKAMFGFADNEIGNNITQWEARLHPEDKSHWKEVLRTLFHTKGSKFSIEYRVRCKDESWKWILTHGIVAGHADNGLVSRMIGTHADITERKKSEQELQFAASVYQAIGEAAMITDGNDRIIAINQAFTKLTGYAPDEAIGKEPDFLRSGRHDQSFMQDMWHKLNTTGIWEGEIWNRRKNGEEYSTWQSIHTIYDDTGKVLRRVSLYSNITDQKRVEEIIRRQAYYDPLTGLPNRSLFLDRLGLEIKKSNRDKLPVALLFIDLDHFKEVNDTFGHYAGDELLQEATSRIKGCVRESDTLARLGGDEFTVIIPELPDARHIDEVAQKILSRLAEPYHLGNNVVRISASIGITMYPNDANSIVGLMKNADQAMYAAKSKGRNRFSHYAAPLQQSAQTGTSLIDSLHGALAAGQLRVYFQPIVKLSTGRIGKAEALLRWQHPTLGMVSPVEFIPLAENTGLMNKIGDWVFKESARYAKQWSTQVADDFQVCINMSPVQFKAAYKLFSTDWLANLHETGLPGKNLLVEITEKLLLNAELDIKGKLLLFREAGVQMGIDDFGTDYSSLPHHKQFGIDYLKIDRPFVLKFADDQGDLAVSELIVMAHQLGIKVIAEGVETEAQRDLLAAAGCDYAQGNLYSKPVLPEEFERLLNLGLNVEHQAVKPVESGISGPILLTEDETAAFLQPYMPGKSVKNWLIKDRQHDPLIPFVVIRGQHFYLEADSEKFVKRILNPAARFVRIRNRLHPERRKMSDRRRAGSRRPIDSDALHTGIMRRRWEDLGWRLNATPGQPEGKNTDRRTSSSLSVH